MKPCTSPAFQVYVRDWIISTRHLSGDARAAHFDLLCYGWEGEGVPDDTTALAAMCALTPAKFRKAWAEIEQKWPLAEDGRRRNPRQEEQRNELREYRQSQSAAGKKGAEARWGK
jgi:uncharacterized protein YdaU (DUF1376 family)